MGRIVSEVHICAKPGTEVDLALKGFSKRWTGAVGSAITDQCRIPESNPQLACEARSLTISGPTWVPRSIELQNRILDGPEIDDELSTNHHVSVGKSLPSTANLDTGIARSLGGFILESSVYAMLADILHKVQPQ